MRNKLRHLIAEFFFRAFIIGPVVLIIAAILAGVATRTPLEFLAAWVAASVAILAVSSMVDIPKMPRLPLALLALSLLASPAEACSRCGVATCYGCNKVAVQLAVPHGYAQANQLYGVIQRDDGTYWRNGLEMEKVRQQCTGSETGWCWSFIPKQSRYVGAQSYTPYANQGTTVGGYKVTEQFNYGQPSYQQYADAYRPDPAALINQLTRATTGAEQLLGRVHQLTADQNQAMLDVAKINAVGTAAAAALSAAKIVPQSTTRTTELSFGAQPAQAVAAQGRFTAQVVAPVAEPAASLVGQKCARCHSGDTAKGGVNLEKFAAFTAEQKTYVMQVANGDVPGKQMPPDAPLTADERRTVVGELLKASTVNQQQQQ